MLRTDLWGQACYSSINTMTWVSWKMSKTISGQHRFLTETYHFVVNEIRIGENISVSIRHNITDMFKQRKKKRKRHQCGCCVFRLNSPLTCAVVWRLSTSRWHEVVSRVSVYIRCWRPRDRTLTRNIRTFSSYRVSLNQNQKYLFGHISDPGDLC